MKIEKNLPFDICESCEDCVLDVEEQILYAEKFIERIICVGCKNERLCKRLKQKGEKENED